MRNIPLGILLLFITGCQTPGPLTTKPEDKVQAMAPPVPVNYRAAYTRSMDLVHTKLDLKISWEQKQLYGKATITLHPHFYATDSLVLNARGMDLHEIGILDNDGKMHPLEFRYPDSMHVFIRLNRAYSRDENLTVFVDYTSNPEHLPAGGSNAITKDKGLYFINADLKNPENPRQLWTQGETESNSAWFPTIEDPQQKMTLEIYLTVDSALTTLSNGLLVTSVKNFDGTRTDYWKQSLPASPYLTMIAVCDFAVVKDKWKNIEVSYFLDKDFEKYAPMIFGRTPEMIECFSQRTGIDYPWEKYAQVVVHDFVSGAMENTTAVVHGTNMLQDSSDYVDGNYEDFISHELFHHWFGDLVTCESWSNLTLNESFANYGEYLWREWKYGRDDADHLHQNDMAFYLLTAKLNDPDLVRFEYENREDVYDAVSYNKGGRILHMLRKEVGDDAFFASLKVYLESHRFGSAEVHDLRLAFERVTGRDLNWFFNQWYYSPGHPEIEISYAWDDSSCKQTITVEQTQDFSKAPLYRIPLRADIYVNGKTEHKDIVLEKAFEVFEWQFPSRPELITLDGERSLLCELKDHKTKENYVFQYYHAPLYMDRLEALSKTGSDYEANSKVAKMMEDGLADPYYNIRVQALKNIGPQVKANKDRMKPVLLQMAVSDSAAPVRAQAMKVLGKYLKDDVEAQRIIDGGIRDLSYNVQAESFKLIAERDKEEATDIARQLEQSSGSDVLMAIGNFYKEDAKDDKNDFYIGAMRRLRSYARGSFANTYAKYLKKVSDKEWDRGVDQIEESAIYSSGYSRRMLVNTLESLSKNLSSRISDAKARSAELETNNSGKNEIELANGDVLRLTTRRDALDKRIRALNQLAEGQ